MKKWMCGLLAAIMGLTLAACGSREPEVKAWTAADGQAIVDSGAFSDELDELDVISSNIIQDHVQELEKFQWFMRSHLA